MMSPHHGAATSPADGKRSAPSPLLTKASKLLDDGDPASADYLLEAYLGGAPDDAEGHNLAGIAKRQLGDLPAARRHLERAVLLAPTEIAFAINCAMLLADLGEGDRALTVIERPLQTKVGHADGLLARTQLLQRLGRREDAVAAARMTVAFNPAEPRARQVLGLALFKIAAFADAVDAFRDAIRLDDAYVEAWINLGVAQKELGDLAGAEVSYRRALALAPRDASIHNNLGNVLSSQGAHDDAFAAFHQALAIDADYADAKVNLALALRDQGRLDDALKILAEAAAAHPAHVALLNTYGNTLRQAERLDEAIEVLQSALVKDPGFAEAHNNLGLALALKFRLDDAADHLARAAALKPESATISNNYGALLLRMFRFEGAVQALQNAIARAPEYDDALINLGIAHYMLGQADSAIAAYERVLARNPDSGFARYSLGVAYLEDQRLTEAEAEIHRALAIDPTNALALNTLGVLLLDQHRITDARAAMLAAADVNTMSAPMFYSNYAFAGLYEPHLSNPEVLEIHKEFGRRYASALPDTAKPHRNDRNPDRKLRLAYLSPDFRAHSVAYFFEALLEKHDRSQFEILLYSDTTRKDVVTEAMRSGADLWVESGGLTNDVFVRRLREDQIDVLVNLGGHTSGNRLPATALKPAPVQIEYLGYPETSGVPAMQYRLVDAQTDPIGIADQWCTEELVRLPDCFHCYRPHGRAPAVAAAPHIEKGYVTFGSFNVLPKVTADVIATWARILNQVPGSRFYLKCKQVRDVRNQDLVRRMFAQHGIAPERISMTAFVPSIFDHLNAYAGVDLALDPFPYNGTTTSCEAMWMGVPVLTMRGDNHRSRVGYSLLHAIGLDGEFVADDVQDYVARAVEFGCNPARLTNVRTELRARMAASPLCDEIGFTRTLENTYRTLWRRWCAGPETTMFNPPPQRRAEDSIQGVLVKTL